MDGLTRRASNLSELNLSHFESMSESRSKSKSTVGQSFDPGNLSGSFKKKASFTSSNNQYPKYLLSNRNHTMAFDINEDITEEDLDNIS